MNKKSRRDSRKDVMMLDGRVDNMFQKEDGRQWSFIKCNGVDIEML